MSANHKNNGTSHKQNGQVKKAIALEDITIPYSEEAEVNPAYLAEVWAKRAYTLAEPPVSEDSVETLDLLVFLLNGERYGVEVQYVREIYPLQQITPVPRTPDFVIGVYSARGQLISVINFRAFVGLTAVGINDDSKIIVMHDPTGTMEIGFLADNVEDVTTIVKDEIEPALVTQLGQRARFIQGVAPGMLIVLNMQILLNDPALLVQEELSS